MCIYTACIGLYVKVLHKRLHCVHAGAILQLPNLDRQDAAISTDQFSLNLDELLMPTFCFLLMGKSFEMDFFLSSQWIHQLFKVSILFPDIAPVERSADQDSWHSVIVALTLSQILNPACINTYSSMAFSYIAPGRRVYTARRIAMCYITAACFNGRRWLNLNWLLWTKPELQESYTASTSSFITT